MLSLGSWAEIIIIVIAALILVGPEELPQILKTCGRLIFKFRRFSNQIQNGINDLINEGQIDEYQQAARDKINADDNSNISVPRQHITPPPSDFDQHHDT